MTLKSNSHQKPAPSNDDKMNALALMVTLRIDELLSELGVSLKSSGNKMVGRCPVHGGDTFGSLNLYPEGERGVPGYWTCRSHFCEKTFVSTIIGFTRGVLSHTKYGWEKPGQQTATFKETLDWLTAFIGQSLDTIKIDEDEVERRKFAAQVSTITKAQIVPGCSLTSKEVRANLKIPADFFLNRGYSPEILDRYDVGLCDKQGKEMCGRVVVPVYDDKSLWLVGCTGRSIYKECPQCNTYHSPNQKCPSDENRWLYSKWKNSKHFDTSNYLYNYWHAKKEIQQTKVVILVEGPGDVWRLEEAGIHNAVALFGCGLHEPQQILLETSGVMSVVLLLDNDESGRQAKNILKNTLRRMYQVYTPEFSGKDIGELSIPAIHSEVLPLIKSLSRRE